MEEKDMLVRLSSLQEYKSDDVQSVRVTIGLRGSMHVTIKAELNNQWGGLTTKRVLWVRGKINQEFVTDIINEFNRWCELSRENKLTYGFMIQKHPATFVDGKLYDPLKNLYSDMQLYTNINDIIK